MRNLTLIFVVVLAFSAGLATGSVHSNSPEITAESYLTDIEAEAMDTIIIAPNPCPDAQDYQIKTDAAGYILMYHGKFVDRFSWQGSRELDSLILADNL